MNKDINILPLLNELYQQRTLIDDLAVLPAVKVGKGQYIFKADELAGESYLLLKGKVKMIAGGESGREIIKSIIEAGQIFGELTHIPNEIRRDNALAGGGCIGPTMNQTVFNELIQKHALFSAAALKTVTGRRSDMERKLESLLFMDSKSRIIAWLVEQTEKNGQRIGYEWAVRNFVTHQEIANLTATSRQSVTTVLNSLRDAGILTFNRRRLLVRDLEKLKSLCQ